MTLILTESIFNNNIILEYKEKILISQFLGMNSIFEPVFSPSFTFATTTSVIIHTYLFLIHRKSHFHLPKYFKLEKNVKFFIFSLIFLNIYFLLNLGIETLIEPNFDLFIEHIFSTIINYVFCIVSVFLIIYFLYFAFNQPYLFNYFGIRRNLFEKGFIGYFLASIYENGPRCISISNQFKNMHHLDEKTISDLSLHTISTIGMFQNEIFEGNMIIPIPLRKDDLIAFTFSLYLMKSDLSFDQRYSKGAPVIYALLMPTDLLKSLNNIGNAYENFMNILTHDKITDINQLTETYLISITSKIIQIF
jgi:hypothetical protein